jgi:plasmid maintenance system killer protein
MSDRFGKNTGGSIPFTINKTYPIYFYPKNENDPIPYQNNNRFGKNIGGLISFRINQTYPIYFYPKN